MYRIEIDPIVTGIGSRKTPLEDQAIMTGFSQHVTSNGGVVRSGGAAAADSAFGRGVTNPNCQEIFLPFANFNGVRHGTGVFSLDNLPPQMRAAAQKIAQQFHPNWNALERKGLAAVKLMTRNVFQVLGPNLNTPSDLLVMWADGTRSAVAQKDNLNRICNAPGGTGLAVRLAYSLHIPVLHTGLQEHRCILQAYCDGDLQLANDLLNKESQWTREGIQASVLALRQSVGLSIPSPEAPIASAASRWKRTSRPA